MCLAVGFPFHIAFPHKIIIGNHISPRINTINHGCCYPKVNFITYSAFVRLIQPPFMTFNRRIKTRSSEKKMFIDARAVKRAEQNCTAGCTNCLKLKENSASEFEETKYRTNQVQPTNKAIERKRTHVGVLASSMLYTVSPIRFRHLMWTVEVTCCIS